MAIDTIEKRRGVNAVRGRLPWFRRFILPDADGAISQADRQQVAFAYRGIAAAEAVEIHPGDATFSRSGVAAVSISRSGPAASTFTRSGVGAVTIGRKQS